MGRLIMKLTRNQIIAEAESWEGTKWQHQASVKGIACDCAGLIRGVYCNLTGIETPMYDYPATWHLFKQEPRVFNECKKYFNEIPIDDVKPGDILIFRFRPNFVAHHLAFVLNNNRIIHADMEAGKVIISNYNATWRARATNAFRLKELEE